MAGPYLAISPSEIEYRVEYKQDQKRTLVADIALYNGGTEPVAFKIKVRRRTAALCPAAGCTDCFTSRRRLCWDSRCAGHHGSCASPNPLPLFPPPFALQTNAPSRFTSRPRAGFVLPHTTVGVEIVCALQQEWPPGDARDQVRAGAAPHRGLDCWERWFEFKFQQSLTKASPTSWYPRAGGCQPSATCENSAYLSNRGSGAWRRAQKGA